MRIFAAILQLALLMPCFGQSTPPLVSPEIRTDRTVTFRCRAPNAKEVTVSGDFTRKPVPMSKDESGVWTATLGPLTPDIYAYSIRVDGVANIDSANPMVKTGFRGSSSGFVVPSDKPLDWDEQPVRHGTLHRHFYSSKAVGDARNFVVYTPPGYDSASKTRYPVLYLLHGSGDLSDSWSEFGKANFILDNLQAQGKARPMLVVMPFGHASTGDGPDNRTRNVELFSKDLLEDIMPVVDKEYRTFADAQHRAIAGLSMGGGQSLWTGLNNPDKFAWVAGFSSGIRSTDVESRFPPLMKEPENLNKKLKLLWIGVGKDDTLVEVNRQFTAALKDKGVRFTYVETEGGHTWRVWRRYLAELTPLLFRSTT